MMKITLLIILSLSSQILSKTTKTPQTILLVHVASTLNNYKKIHNGDLPASWNILLTTEFFSPDSLLRIRSEIDIENRYQFTHFKDFFEIGGVKEKIVVIANQPGDEGDYGLGTSGRFLMVETLKGEIQTRKYSEKQLKFILGKNGYNLSDYTISIPSPFRKNYSQNIESKSHGIPKFIDFFANKKTDLEILKPDFDNTFSNVVVLALFATAGFTLIGWYIIRQRRNK